MATPILTPIGPMNDIFIALVAASLVDDFGRMLGDNRCACDFPWMIFRHPEWAFGAINEAEWRR